MKNKRNDYVKNILPCLGYGIICGSVTGGVIFLFKYAAKIIEELSRKMYAFAKGSPLYMCACFAVILLLGFATLALHKRIPEAKGGGIPRSEGILRGLIPVKHLKTFLGTVIGSFISYFCGLPVGSEGPAVLIGTTVGGFSVGLSKNKSAWSRYVMTGGAGAGFAVATGSPLTAMLFALEEIHRRFTPMLVMTVSVSVLSATFVNKLLCMLCGMSSELFKFEINSDFQLKHLAYLLLLGVIIAFAVGGFDTSIELFGKFTKRINKKFSKSARLIFVFMMTGVWGFVFPDGLYSGHSIIEDITENRKELPYLLLLLAVRLFMMLLITDCGATGGIFIPTLAIGVTVSAITVKLLYFWGFPQELCGAAVLLGMCAFIGGTLRSPFTCAVLFLELTGQFTNLFYVAAVVFTVNLITELLGKTSFYDTVLENIAEKHIKNKTLRTSYFNMTVSQNAFVVGKTVRDVLWPYYCVVLNVKHRQKNNDSSYNDGEKRLYPGDKLTARARYYDIDEIKKDLSSLVGTDFEITETVIDEE